ncbi:MAG: GNAT family N-acetyltransferase [Phycisphaerae bacterium]|nr:GNAT family N-acetyltransferase [Phycisphaerae bacterium]
MATADIIPVGLGELDLVADLYNQVFAPPRDADSLRRRFEGRRNILILIAQLERRPVGFLTGMELKPDTHFGWLCGVLSDYRRAGIASQLLEAHLAWARDQGGYELLRFECYNRHRPMLHTAITHGYNIVGIRWDSQHHDNLVIFEKELSEG